MVDKAKVRGEIRDFVIQNFLFGDTKAKLEDKQSFLESGIIDSTGVLEIVAFLEEKLGVKVEDLELLPENMDSVDNLVGYVARKLDAAR